MGFPRLKWLTIIIPALAVALFDYLRHAVWFDTLHSWPGTLLMMLLLVVGASLLSEVVFSRFEARERTLLHTTRELATLSAIADAVSRSADLVSVVDTALIKVLVLMRLEAGAIFLTGEQRGLVLSSHHGLSASFARNLGGMRLEQTPLGQAAQLAQTVLVNSFQDDTSGLWALAREEGLWAMACVPLVSGQKVQGVILLGSRGRSSFLRDRGLMAVIGQHVGVVVDNARLYQQAQNLAVLEERDRIAREMHDSLAQVLGYLNLKARATRDLVRSGHGDRVEAELGEMSKVAEEAYVDVREAILGLRESISPGAGLEGTLGEYLQKFGRQTRVKARLVVHDGASTRFPPAVEVQLVRIIQEALTNVRKHAAATMAWVKFERENGQARITVEDNGRGFDLTHVAQIGDRSFGIRTMRERVASIQGKMEIDSTPGRGTRVIVRLPYDSEGD